MNLKSDERQYLSLKKCETFGISWIFEITLLLREATMEYCSTKRNGFTIEYLEDLKRLIEKVGEVLRIVSPRKEDSIEEDTRNKESYKSSLKRIKSLLILIFRN